MIKPIPRPEASRHRVGRWSLVSRWFKVLRSYSCIFYSRYRERLRNPRLLTLTLLFFVQKDQKHQLEISLKVIHSSSSCGWLFQLRKDRFWLKCLSFYRQLVGRYSVFCGNIMEYNMNIMEYTSRLCPTSMNSPAFLAFVTDLWDGFG